MRRAGSRDLPLLSLWRLRRGLNRERGAAAVEAAIILPMVLLIFFAIVEFGLVFKDWLGVVSATRAGARTASAMSTNGGSTDPYFFATQAAAQMAATSTAIDRSTVTAVWIYQANPDGTPVGGNASFTSCSVCDKYVWNGTTFAPTTQMSFPYSSLNTCSNVLNRTRIGVYMQAQHQAITGFIFQSLTLSEHVVMIVEPQAGVGC